MISLTNRIKKDSQIALDESSFNYLVRIRVENPESDDYDATSALQSWLSSAAPGPNQSFRKKYKS